MVGQRRQHANVRGVELRHQQIPGQSNEFIQGGSALRETVLNPHPAMALKRDIVDYFFISIMH